MIELFMLGGPLMYPLLICLVIAVVIVLERAVFWALIAKDRNDNHIELYLKALKQGDTASVEKIQKQSKDAIVKVLSRVSTYETDQLSFAMDMEVTKEFSQYKKYSNVLDTIIAVAPLIGILGTVVGIIVSFQNMAISGMDDPKAITGGIGQALITTASGLAIAIVSLLSYNYFNSKIEGISEETESYLSELELIKSIGFKGSLAENLAKKIDDKKTVSK